MTPRIPVADNHK